MVETDNSVDVSASVLSQHNDSDTLHPVAFYSKKHSPTKCKCKLDDKKLLAMIWYSEECRPLF